MKGIALRWGIFYYTHKAPLVRKLSLPISSKGQAVIKVAGVGCFYRVRGVLAPLAFFYFIRKN